MRNIRCLLGLLVCSVTFPADFRAGVARIAITPEGPIWMSGYANRTKPSEGKIHDLWAKALALQDPKGGRLVIVTTDLIGLPRSISDVVAARVEKQFGLDRSKLVLNSSHTHTGPVVRPNLISMFTIDEAQDRVLRDYARTLTDTLVNVVGAALGDLSPAQAAYSAGSAAFAINRRQPTEKGIRIGLNPSGPVDHSVPVIRITRPGGTVRAILFGYACHNTTLTGDFYQLSGDYAGFAQSAVETQHPGATALFIMLCGADQNPNPRSSLALARQHGEALAAEVSRLVGTRMERLKGPLRTAFLQTDLALASHERGTFEAMRNEKNPARKNLAEAMIRAYDERRPVVSVPYPIQVARLGKHVTLLALGGEVVVDYSLRAKREYPKATLIVAGYSNDVMCYIPSARILKEGGYEAVDSMVYYGQPGPFTPAVEETIFAAIRQAMKRVGL